MSYVLEEKFVTAAFERADIAINGARPWDIRVTDRRFYRRVILQDFLGFGESYMDGWWTCDQLDVTCERLLRAGILPKDKTSAVLQYVRAKMINLQSRARAGRVIDAHYDFGNELFETMLDPRMVYTCGYWRNGATSLAEAQEAKLDLVCRKLGLQPGMRVLDIGCGYGSFMKFASERYGVECVGYSLSKNQTDVGHDLCKGLPIEFILKDYREISGQFDRIASIGMFEAVGAKNFRPFMKVLARAMKPDAVALLHTFGDNVSHETPDPWFHKYIFPNGLIPSVKQVATAMDDLLRMEDWHTFGTDYDPTLLAWNKGFQTGWPDLQIKDPLKYTAQFKRMWEFYLLSLAAAFRVRNIELWQIVMTPFNRSEPGSWRQS